MTLRWPAPALTMTTMSTKTVNVEPTSPTRRRLGWIAALAIAASTAVLISYDTSAADPAPDAPDLPVSSSGAGGRLTFR